MSKLLSKISNKKNLKIVFYVLKFVASGFALWYIFVFFGKEEISESIKNSNPFSVFFALILYIFSQYVSTLRLNLIVKKAGIEISTFENFKLYLIGMAYNLFLPGGIGGDGYKLLIYKNDYNADGKKAFLALILERAIGMVVIFILIAVILSISTFDIRYKHFFWIVAPILYGVSILIFNIIFKYFKNLFTRGMIWSALIQVIQILALYVLAYSFGQTNWIDLACIFLLSTIATAVPVFLGGLGAREFVFGLLATQVGMENSVAVTLAVLFSFVTILSSLPGLVLDWFRKRSNINQIKI